MAKFKIRRALYLIRHGLWGTRHWTEKDWEEYAHADDYDKMKDDEYFDEPWGEEQ